MRTPKQEREIQAARERAIADAALYVASRIRKARSATPLKVSRREWAREARYALRRAIMRALGGESGFCSEVQADYDALRDLLDKKVPGMELDHRYPLAKAASRSHAFDLNRLNNLQWLPRTLNRQKGASI